jgi:hypothetical protein
MRGRLSLLLLVLAGCGSSGDANTNDANDLGPALPDASLPHDPINEHACGHAHNDYDHARPLLDALDHGFCSVEADIWLVDGELRIGHDLASTMPGRTLESLYLAPLETWVAAHGGRVIADRDDFTLLVDVKSAGADTWTALDAALMPHAAMVTEWNGHTATPRAVTVVVSGNRSPAVVTAQTQRRAALDGREPELSGPDGQWLYPLVSLEYGTLGLAWRGQGPVSDDDRAKLAGLAAEAHSRGQHFRIYGWPVDNADAWGLERDSGIDRVNADDLAGLQQFLAGP